MAATLRRPGGYAVMVEADGTKKEWDTFTCSHCMRVLHVTPTLEWGHCKNCNHIVCSACYGVMMTGGGCQSFKRRIDEEERRARNLMGAMGGGTGPF